MYLYAQLFNHCRQKILGVITFREGKNPLIFPNSIRTKIIDQWMFNDPTAIKNKVHREL